MDKWSNDIADKQMTSKLCPTKFTITIERPQGITQDQDYDIANILYDIYASIDQDGLEETVQTYGSKEYKVTITKQ